MVFFDLKYSDSVHADTLVISYMGYKPLRLTVNKLIDNRFELSQLPVDIDEIVVRPAKKKAKTIVLNKFNKRDCMLHFSISPFDTTGNVHVPHRPKEPTFEATYLPYDSKYPEFRRIKSVQMRVLSIPDSFQILSSIFPDSYRFFG